MVEVKNISETVSSEITQPATAEIAAIAMEEEPPAPAAPVQKNKSRCFKCSSKLSLSKQISNKCRCELIFCDAHKLANGHDCAFDDKKMHGELLVKKLVKSEDGKNYTKI